MANTPFRATHSTLAPRALSADILPAYDIGEVVECHLMILGLNDTYLVQTGTGPYVLRVYRAHWRTLPEICYELDVLRHLAGKGVAVSRPIARKDGAITASLSAVEGTRYAVLFSFAPGNRPRLDEEHSWLYGKALAKIHNALNDFSSAQPRSPLDLDCLLERPLKVMLPYFAHRPADCDHLRHLAELLRNRMARLSTGELTMGICHGDVHDENAHVDQNGVVTLFDFDCCGPGWTAYDLATFRWRLARLGHENGVWPAFLAGYATSRRITETDRRSIPLLVGLRDTWQMSLHFINGAVRGFGTLDEQFLDWKLQFSREWTLPHISDGRLR